MPNRIYRSLHRDHATLETDKNSSIHFPIPGHFKVNARFKGNKTGHEITEMENAVSQKYTGGLDDLVMIMHIPRLRGVCAHSHLIRLSPF
jgi:hypothetical protein